MSRMEILERDWRRAERILCRMYGDTDAPLHNCAVYMSSHNDYLIVLIAVDDPERDGMLCWKVMGEVHIDGSNRPKYFVRLPCDEHYSWDKDGNFDDGVRKLPCPQDVKGMLETMESYRLEYIRTGYRKLLNDINIESIEALP